jgi:hypothetical protein
MNDQRDDGINRRPIHSTDNGQCKPPWTEAVQFLELLRPAPWVLAAVDPITGVIATYTAHSTSQATTFINNHNGKRNLYYTVNPTIADMNKKPKKTDIASIEYYLGDLDPRDDESAEDAKARYLDQLGNGFEPKPTATIDSGNGIQCLWRLSKPRVLGEDRDTVVADAEACSAVLMERLGAKAGTQNIDRILRIPGTINLPNAVKAKKGRVPCPAKLLDFNQLSYPAEVFVPGSPDDGGHHARQPDDEPSAAADQKHEHRQEERR